MDQMCIKVEPPDFWDDSTYDSIAGTSSSTLNEDAMTNILKPSEIKDLSEDTQETNFETFEEFYFDSDHPALKNNNDYKELLKAVTVLEAQKARAIKDLDKLHELKEKALADPIGFVECLQQGKKIDFPTPQNVYPVPVIDWNKYTFNASSSSFSRRQLTRLSTRATQDIFKNNAKEKSSRLHEQKPPKVNQYWTAEEQKQLEELLIKFPPEEIESRRWEKIANCLENRTPIQVASRVQKYFIKLLKAGMPIPGRMPNMTYLKKPRRNVIRNQPSTFLVSHTLPVYMPEADEELNYSYHQPQTSEENSMESRVGMSEDEEFNPELRETPEYKELVLLKKIQREKIQSCGFTQHIGFKCSNCKTEPIIGIRWHCTDCKPPTSVDFCENCADGEYEIGQHTSNHRLEEVHSISSNFHDRGYLSFLSGNFVDPSAT
ncbi:ZZ-type zinc finger-containing protein 3 [Argiope bruennichi]|uniref:ZZ-type zinc finger-containing protein 3 n=2 Tax=Argiope bruennichi TaxID=94029 RepID=A0A8T0FE47_ARGBR|nr:ZZ-type zinc finger-containing protein 3 [Argiope bruennichi]